MDFEEFFARHCALLQEEKSAEAESNIVLKGCGTVSMSLVKRKGITFMKVRLTASSSGILGRTTLQFHISEEKDSLKSRAITVGDIAAVFQRSEDGGNKMLISAVVAKLNSASIYLTTDYNNPQNLQISNDQDYFIMKLVDDVTYRRMKNALQSLRRRLKDEEGSKMARALFYMAPISRIDPDQMPEITFFNENLNEKQKGAVKFALCQNEIAIIHGPPGTGKITTLVEIILQMVKQDKKVLICGPSNVSVDNLVEKLSKYKVRMTRLGHPARSSESAYCHTLEAAISSSCDGTLIHDIKKELDSVNLEIEKEKKKDVIRILSTRARELSRDMFAMKNKITQNILKNSDVVLSTLSTSHRDCYLKLVPEDFFDVAVIDECSQAIEALCWIPLLQVKKCILAGDHLQLPPIIYSTEAEKGGLGETIMERLVNFYKDDVTCMLTLQYRMNLSIMEWSSIQLYDSKLEAHPSVASHLLCDLPDVEENEETCVPLLLIDTIGYCTGEIENEDESKANEVEAHLVFLHVEALIKSGLSPSDIGVVSPYNFQCELIRSMLAEKYPSTEIKSVDSFQGREKEAIILSLVRSNDEGNVGFLAEDRRINVAITRARRHLAVICNSRTVTSHEFLKKLIDYISKTGEVRSAFSYSKELNSIQLVDRKRFGSKVSQSGNSQTAKKEKKKSCNKQVEKQRKTSWIDNSNSKQTHSLQQQNTILNHFTSTIKEFVEDSNTFSFKFPTSLTAYERLIVHEVAENFNLVHVSNGEGEKRYIEIRKPLIENSGDFNSKNLLTDSFETEKNHNDQPLGDLFNVVEKKVCREPIKSDYVRTIKEKKSRIEDKHGRFDVKKHISEKKSNIDNSEDDFDAVIEAARKENTTCSHPSCNESTSVSVLIKPCKFCKKQFCFKHLLPEIHGCGDDAKTHARQMSKKPQIPSSTSQKSKIYKHDLARKMEKVLEEKNRERQRKTGKKQI